MITADKSRMVETTSDDKKVSYASMYNELKNADSTDSFFSSLEMLFTALLSLGTHSWFFAFYIIPIFTILLGAWHYDHCQVESNIPLWLIVVGSVALFKGFCDIIAKVRGRVPVYLACSLLYGTAWTLFSIVWFILGSIWVLSAYGKVQYDMSIPDTYCNQIVYLWAFFSILFGLVFISVLCIAYICCCFCFVLSVFKS